MTLMQRLRSSFQSGTKGAYDLVQLRKDPSTIRIIRPSRLDRAKALGYKAKPGIIVVRQRIPRGGKMRPDIKGGRRSKHMRQSLVLSKGYQTVAEERAQNKYPNMEVLNSYLLIQDGKHSWYEVILLDRSHPAILADPNFAWASFPGNRGRVYRGLTSSGKRGRGLRNKGRGAEKIRPSRHARD